MPLNTVRSRRLNLSPLAVVISLAFGTLPGLGLPTALAAQNVQTFHIPAGNLTLQLARFAQQAGIELARNAQLTEGKTGPTLEGDYAIDVALATPDMMGVVGPLGRVLGPRGLMPSPRSGTVTTDISSAVREFKAGKIEFRNDKGGNVAAPVGKLNFSEDQLVENITTFLNHLRTVKPAAAKGTYIRSVTISATMSPGIRILA